MFSAHMEASFEQLDGYLMIAVTGRLDSVSAPQFDEQLAPALVQPHARILIDMAGVSYISSAGVRSILQLVKLAVQSGGRVGLFSVPPQIMKVIEMSGLPLRLDLYPDRAGAMDHRAS
jgi:anti-anti-sigma factor